MLDSDSRGWGNQPAGGGENSWDFCKNDLKQLQLRLTPIDLVLNHPHDASTFSKDENSVSTLRTRASPTLRKPVEDKVGQWQAESCSFDVPRDVVLFHLLYAHRWKWVVVLQFQSVTVDVSIYHLIKTIFNYSIGISDASSIFSLPESLKVCLCCVSILSQMSFTKTCYSMPYWEQFKPASIFDLLQQLNNWWLSVRLGHHAPPSPQIPCDLFCKKLFYHFKQNIWPLAVEGEEGLKASQYLSAQTAELHKHTAVQSKVKTGWRCFSFCFLWNVLWSFLHCKNNSSKKHRCV